MVVERYEETVERLRDGRLRGSEPQTEFWGAARAYLRDPAGHRVEIMAAPPPYAE